MNHLLKIFCMMLFSQAIQASNSTIPKEKSQLPFEIYTNKHKAVILYDKEGSALDLVVSYFLAEDIYKITNYRPKVTVDINEAEGNVIVVGNITSNLIGRFIEKQSVAESFLNQWESYLYRTILNPDKKINKAFIIAGTNPRGTAYGVFDISKKIGVSPWYWWADVPVKEQKELMLNQKDFQSQEPSVKYRGIFLNDEDWGLQPWAAKTFEPETKDIGPKTYAKIFELLLRLKANTIWPAMHSSTKAFFHYPGNAKMATLYNIVLGTSHAEPMMRNNVDEWSKDSGRFNYKTNRDNVYKYWENRVNQTQGIDAIYTIGMRGVHDSAMEGVKDNDEAVTLLNTIIKDQRNLLQTNIKADVTKVPQVFTVYKEVLDLYKNGLAVPEDITLVWTDDNYGYIRSLSNSKEQLRSGGSGVYYHVSYWGRPHDYLWLDTTNPFLVREEMMKAYNLKNREIWILNVGDIKPAEYNTQLFLDIAFNADKFQNPESVTAHQKEFYREIFGNQYKDEIQNIQTSYFQLGYERKPEFMGWSQTEPTTPIFNTAYNALSNGDEIQQRIDMYQNIARKAGDIEKKLPENLRSTYTQLIAYPVRASAEMNKKFLYKDKALVYAGQERKSAFKYKEMSDQAYNSIVELTKDYNELSNGKWKGFMDMKPRKLPVFQKPEINIALIQSKEAIGISVEDTLHVSKDMDKLPVFYEKDSQSHFIDVYLKGADKASWKFDKLPNWVKVSEPNGILKNGEIEEQRINISINWQKWEKAGKPLNDVLTIQEDSFEKKIQIIVSNSYNNTPANSIFEKNGTAVAYAQSYSSHKTSGDKKWQLLNGLGHSAKVLQAVPLESLPVTDFKESPVLEYEFFTETITDEAQLALIAVPTHPLESEGKVRIAMQWNDDPVKVIDFKTEGRSKEWKENVLSNKAVKINQVSLKEKGKQKLKIYMVDAGVMLDYIVLKTNKVVLPYQLGAETRIGR